MPVESAGDRASFLNPDEFGVAATYRIAATLATSGINGIFDNAYVAADTGGETVASTTAPAFIARTQDLPGEGVYGDSIILSASAVIAAGLSARFAGTWTIRGLQPDGTGMTVMWLERLS